MESLFGFIGVGLGYILRFFYSIIPNYFVVIILFALATKIILFPLGIKQQKNMVKQAKLRPKETAIRKKYAGRTDKVTQQKMQQEIMDLYQKENFNPMGGCLPLVVQFPILISLYYVIRSPLTYICRLSKDSVASIKNILIEKGVEIGAATSEIDYISYIRDMDLFPEVAHLFEGTAYNTLDKLPTFNIGPIDLAGTPSLALNWLLLVPVLTFVFMFLSMKLNRKLSYQPEQVAQAGCSMKMMDYTMPLLSVWITFEVPAIVGVYWIFQNIFGTLQQFILKLMYPYPVFTEEEMRAAEKEILGSGKKVKKAERDPSKPKPRSLHHIDDEELAEEKQGASSKNEESEKSSKEEAPAKLVEKKDPASGNELIGKAKLKDDNDGR